MKWWLWVLVCDLLLMCGVFGVDYILIGCNGGIECDYVLFVIELGKVLGKVLW